MLPRPSIRYRPIRTTGDGSSPAASPPPVLPPCSPYNLRLRTWPKSLPEQVQTLSAQLATATAPAPLTAEALARRYTGARAAKVAEVLDTLVALGQAHRDDASWYAA